MNISQTYRCLETPHTSRLVAEAMAVCTESVKANIIEEAFTILRYQWEHHQAAEHSAEPLAHSPSSSSSSAHTHFAHHAAHPAAHVAHVSHAQHQPLNFGRQPPGIGADLLRHVHHVHRLPGQLHQLQASYPPLNGGGGSAALHAQHAHSHLPHQTRPGVRLSAATTAVQPQLDSDSYFEYQHFDPDMNFKKRRRSEDDGGAEADGETVGTDCRRRRRATAEELLEVSEPRVGKKTIEISMQEKRIAGVSDR